MDSTDIKANLSKEDLLKMLFEQAGSASKEDILKMLLSVEDTSTAENTLTENETKQESQPNTSYVSNEIAGKPIDGQRTHIFANKKMYPVRSGTNNSGWDYEFKMLALLCIRGILKKPEKMWIAGNAKGVGAFDDIVCHFKINGISGITYMIQMKHNDSRSQIKSNDFMDGDNSPFNLVKHVKGFSELKETLMKTTSSEDLFKDLDPDKIVSVFFTNRVAADSGIPNFNGCTSEDLMFLNTIVENKHFYKFDVPVGSALGLSILDLKIKDYCENIYFISNQVSKIGMVTCILDEMKKLIKQLGLAKIDADKITKEFIEYITERAKCNGKERLYLTQGQILYKLTDLFLSQYAVTVNDELRASYNCPNKKIWMQIMDDKKVTYVASDEVTVNYLQEYVSSEVQKDYRTLMDKYSNLSSENQKSFFHQNSNFEIIVGKQGTPNVFDVYQHMWVDNKIPLLLEINNEEEHQNVLTILNWSKLDLKIIIVNKVNLTLPALLNTKTNFVNLNDLNDENRGLILDKSVSLQGRKGHKLGDLLNGSMYEFIECNDIIRILIGNYNIGNNYSSVQYFIERSLNKILIKFEALKVIEDEAFIIHDQAPKGLLIKKLEYLNLNYGTPNLIVCQDITKVNTKEVKSEYKTIHRLIFYEENWLEWMESQGETKRIKEHLVQINNSHSSIRFRDKIRDDVLTKNVLNKTQVFSGYTGIGKSTLMDFISKEAPTNTWVLKITLNDHTDYYEKAQCEKASDHIKYFNEKIINVGSCFNIPLAEAVFHKLLAEKKILVLMDGFDEVSVSYKEETTKMMKSLRESGYHMWISTRPHMNSHLEEEFHTIAITIIPFTSQDQQHFFIKYFTEVIQNSEMYKSHIKTFSQKLLKAAEKNLNDWDCEFMKIPLQCKVLADSYTNDLETSLSQNVINLNEDFNLLQLCEDFMNEKKDILCKKYGKYAKRMHEKFFNYYQKLLALKILFRKSDLCELDIDQKLRNYYQNKDNCMEILQMEGVLTVHEQKQTFSATFVPHIYAEFIAAQWLKENRNSENSKIKNTVEFLLNQRFSAVYRHRFVFKIFDSLFAKGFPLHSAIINKQILQTTNISPGDITKFDECKRSIPHLIALYFDTNTYKSNSLTPNPIVDIIETIPVGQMVDLYGKDSFGYNPLDYAVVSKCLPIIIDKFYENSKKIMITVDISKYHHLFGTNSNDCKFALNNRLQYLAWKCIQMDLNDNLSYLSDSIRNEDLSSMKKLDVLTTTDLIEKFNIKPTSENYYSDLRFAAAFGTVDNVKQLLAEGADVNQRIFGYTPLFCAVQKNRSEIVKILLSEMAEVNTTCLNSNTALHAACEAGYEDLTETLIKSGANVNKRNEFGETPLFLASKKHHIDIVNLLLQHGANVNILNNTDDTCLHVAAKKGFQKLLLKFIQYGTDINISNTNGKTSLFLALENGQTDVANLLVEHDIKFDIADHHGNSYLHAAAETGEIDIIRLLIEKGLDINKQNEYGETPLFYALEKGHSNVAKYLLDNKAKVDCINILNNSCLHVAAKLGEIGIVQHIIKEDFNFNLENDYGETPLSLARKNNHISVVELLEENDSKIDEVDGHCNTSLHAAAKADQSHIARKFINAGLNINKQNNVDETPILNAVSYAKALISCGVYFTLRTKTDSYHLHHAAQCGCLEDWIKFLLRNDYTYTNNREYDLTVINGKKQTLLHISVLDICPKSIAKLQHHKKTVKFLLSSGIIDVNKKDIQKRTVLHYICNYSSSNSLTDDFYENVATLILNTAIDIHAKDVRGKTAMDLATKNHHCKIASLIQQQLDNVEYFNKSIAN